MKVYKHGNIDDFQEIKVTCKNCECEFSYYERELLSGVTFDSDKKELITFRYVPCPECKSLLLHQEEEPADGSSDASNTEIEDLDTQVDDEF